MRRWVTLAYLISTKLDRHGPVDPAVTAALIGGAAQLYFLDKVPAHAAIDESVSWAKSAGKLRAAGLVNAVLRRLSELIADGEPRPVWTNRRDELPLSDGRALVLRDEILPTDPVERAALATSHPRGVVRAWAARLGQDAAIRLAWHNIGRPPIVLNIAHAATPPNIPPLDALLSPHSAAGHAVYTGEPTNLGSLLEARPDLWVQDSGSARAVAGGAAGFVREPKLIVDLCAGQGTKTRQLALTFPNARVIATDVDGRRAATLRRTFAGASRVSVCRSEELERACPGIADLVLLDVPCSNTGTLGRRPEAKYRAATDQLERLVPLQRQIVRRGVGLCRSGGVVLYSTCSVEPAENGEQAMWAAGQLGLRVLGEELTLPVGTPAAPPSAYADGSYWMALQKR